MKDLVQCRKLEAKFRRLAVSDPTKRFIWLAEAEKWEHEAEAEIASHLEARNAVRTTGAIDQWSHLPRRAFQKPSKRETNYERYLALARAQTLAGDQIEAENSYQHAEHYFRSMSERAR